MSQSIILYPYSTIKNTNRTSIRLLLLEYPNDSDNYFYYLKSFLTYLIAPYYMSEDFALQIRQDSQLILLIGQMKIVSLIGRYDQMIPCWLEEYLIQFTINCLCFF